MKLAMDLALKQSLVMTTDMRLAIDILGMSASDLDQLINEELLKNPWLEEHYQDVRINPSYADEHYDNALETASYHVDFREALMKQVREGNFNQIEIAIADAIIHNLNDDGLLEDATFADWVQEELGVFPEWVESVRQRIMDLSPIGCAALSINESLLHQAKRKCLSIHDEFLAILADLKNNPDRKLTVSVLKGLQRDQFLSELKELCPRPARPLAVTALDSFIYPDVIVKNSGDQLVITLAKKPSDRVLFKKYSALAHKMPNKKNQHFLKNSFKRASFILRALRFREQSLLTVARSIVFHQESWFKENNPVKPLNLKQIALSSFLHESSVSRLTRGKFLFCEKGCYELKYFFSSSIGKEGQEASGLAVKDHIRSIIDRENKTSPYTDSELTKLLHKAGFAISRRTVAKYRENLHIAKASDRRAML